MRLTIVTCLVLACLTAGCAPQESARQGLCEMREVATLPVLNGVGTPLVRVALNGVPVAFVVDTGAQRSMIFEATAARLHLPTDLSRAQTMMGIGGTILAHPVTVDTLSLDTAAARHVDLLSVPGGPERSVAGLPVAGLFGGDFLANYDVALLLPDSRIGLYVEGRGCGDHLHPPWGGAPIWRVPFALKHATAIGIAVTVEGRPLTAFLDSGASRTILDRRASRAGAGGGERHAVARGVDGNGVSTSRHRFGSVEVGPERFTDVVLDVGDIAVTGLLGADYLRARRVWISYPHAVLYVQPLSDTRPEALRRRDPALPTPSQH